MRVVNAVLVLVNQHVNRRRAGSGNVTELGRGFENRSIVLDPWCAGVAHESIHGVAAVAQHNLAAAPDARFVRRTVKNFTAPPGFVGRAVGDVAVVNGCGGGDDIAVAPGGRDGGTLRAEGDIV